MSQPARVLGTADLRRLLRHASTHRYPPRSEVMILLSYKAGLRTASSGAVCLLRTLDISAERLSAGIRSAKLPPYQRASSARHPSTDPMASNPDDQLYLKFHGRILDSLGIQMYQSPVAAVAELIANAWDADARSVTVTLPDSLDGTPELTVVDDGVGMTFRECQDFYLNVGRNRRADGAARSPSGRPALGRKGIGKFAGFGIADVMRVETVSGVTGERTVFELDIRELRSDLYVDVTPRPVTMIERLNPDPSRLADQGTVIRLRQLKLHTVRNPEPFARSMARRFNLAALSSDFAVTINDVPLPADVEPFPVQFDFPTDYEAGERPDGIAISDGWATETLGDGNIVRWRIRFSETPIGAEEFRGVSVFCGVKIAQNPFFFNLSGGLGGQHGQQYMTGTRDIPPADGADSRSRVLLQRRAAAGERVHDRPPEHTGTPVGRAQRPARPLHQELRGRDLRRGNGPVTGSMA